MTNHKSVRKYFIFIHIHQMLRLFSRSLRDIYNVEKTGRCEELRLVPKMDSNSKKDLKKAHLGVWKEQQQQQSQRRPTSWGNHGDGPFTTIVLEDRKEIWIFAEFRRKILTMDGFIMSNRNVEWASGRNWIVKIKRGVVSEPIENYVFPMIWKSFQP